jgi:hypothetical protein
MITTVEFPATAFRLTAYVRVPDVAAMDAMWIAADAGGAPVTLLGPYVGADPDTRQLRARNAIRVRHKYVPLVLGNSFTPRQLWDQLVVPIFAAGEDAELEHLVNWCCVTCTHTTDANNQPGAPATMLVNGLIRREPDANLQRHIRDRVFMDLPAVDPRQARTEPQMTQFLAGL